MSTKEIKNYYNDSYQKFTPDLISSPKMQSILKQNNESLIRFIKDYFSRFGGLEQLHNRSVLELGCGHAGLSHFLSTYTQDLTALDFSELAIIGARQLAKDKGINIDLICSDITSGVNLKRKFDFIFDSHLLHCITDKNRRSQYFNFLKNHLSDGGQVLIETMTYNEQIIEPMDYSLDENYVLSKTMNDKNVPLRYMPPAIDIETELKANGLKIKTFFYHDELSFNVFPEYTDYAEFRLPKILRISLELN